MDDTIVTIYLERAVDVIDDKSTYDPAAPYAKPQFYAHIIYLAGDIPNECELRVVSYGNGDMIRITPRQLDETGELFFPEEALQSAIQAIKTRTEENERARASFHAEVITADQEREEDGASTDR